MHVALIVVPDERDRADVAAAAEACGLRTLLSESVFEAMGYLGRTDIGAIVFPVGRRVLAVRGLCQLAVRHHPNVLFFAQREPNLSTSEVLKALQYPRLKVVEPGEVVDLIPDIAQALRVASSPFELARTFADMEAGDGDDEPSDAYDDDDTEATLVHRHVEPDTLSGPQRPISLSPPPNFGGDDDDDETLPHRIPPIPLLVQRDEDTAPLQVPGLPNDDEDTEATTPNIAFSILQPSDPTQPGAPPAARRGVIVTATLPSLTDDHSTVDSNTPLLEGDLEDTSGIAVLMTLCVQGLTGHLAINKEPGIFVYAGDPVWAEHPEGPQGWLDQMIRGGHVPADSALQFENEAELISGLMDQNLLRGQASHNLCRGLVSEQVNRVIESKTGSFAFHEQSEFLKTAPLVRVSLFGLLLARIRIRSSPSELLRQSNDMGELRIFPRASLATVSPRLSSFASGHNLAEVIDGQRLGSEIWSELRLDPLTGVLLITALIESNLVTLNDEFTESTGRIELTIPASVPLPVPYSDLDDAGSSEEEESARDEIFTLYMRLKPLSLPRDVLGVPIDADPLAIEAAYESRMGALRPEHIPSGSARQLMVARVLELREKVTRAYESLQLMDKSSEGGGPW